MTSWIGRLRANPLEPLLATENESLVLAVRRDFMGERQDPRALWNLSAPASLMRRQREDGSWPYPGRSGPRSHTDYGQLATYDALARLVYQHQFDARHPGVERAGEYLLASQADEGDLRGIYGSQYTPNYTAAILAVLLDAGWHRADPRVERGMRWLLSVRQNDGGWAIPWRTRSDATSFAQALALPKPHAPDRSRPCSHLITGIVLRAFSAHGSFRRRAATQHAGELLASRMFRRDAYPDRQAASYWGKLRYPFYWTDIGSALDSLLRIGFPAEHPETARALTWLAEQQGDDGLWRSAYGKAADPDVHLWTTYAVARDFRLAYGREMGSPAKAKQTSRLPAQGRVRKSSG